MQQKIELEAPKFTRKEGVTVGILTLVILELLTYFIYYYAYEAQKGEILEGLNRTGNVLQSIVDKNQHAQWRDAEQAADERYQFQEMQLHQALRSDSSLEFIYTVIQDQDSSYRFVFDPTEPGDHDGDGVEDKSYLMEIYESPSQEMIACFRDHTAKLTQEVYYDKWGGHISCFVPLINSAGEFEGVLGVDISVTTYIERLRPIQEATRRAMLAVLFMTFLFGTAVWFLRAYQAIILNRKQV